MRPDVHGLKGMMDPDTRDDRYFYVYMNRSKLEGLNKEEVQQAIDFELKTLRKLMLEELWDF